MSKVHVFPISEAALHNTFQGGADCVCEPKILDLGWDSDGQPARVFLHHFLSKTNELAMAERGRIA